MAEPLEPQARLDEIVRLFEDNGCPVFNPHRYTLEEGGMKRTDAGQFGALLSVSAQKRDYRSDTQELDNPAKLPAPNLVQEIREWFSGPLALSGSIANGRAVLAARAMGAAVSWARCSGEATIDTMSCPFPRTRATVSAWLRPSSDSRNPGSRP